MTTIDLTAPTTYQVARGSIVTDRAGTRQATLLLAPGTQATLVPPGGATQPLSTLRVPSTEYPVDDAGAPRAMPALLPPRSGFTYAVEFSIDEALVAPAVSVRFTTPITTPAGWRPGNWTGHLGLQG